MKLGVAIAWYAVAAHGCTIPDLSEVDLTECLDACAVGVEDCLGAVSDAGAMCVSDDVECYVDTLRGLGVCVSSWGDCATSCTRELEEAL